MTLTAMLAELYRRGRYGTTPATEVTTRLTAFLNETQQELAEDPRLASLLRGTLTFTTTASRAEYGLPPIIGRIVVMRDTTNRWPLTLQSLSWYRAVLPDQTSQTGTPTAYAELGPKPVTKQPAAATGVWAVSTSVSDTAITTSLEGVRTGGYPYQPSATTLTGTTRVQLGTSITDYVEIIDWYLSAAAVGDVTLYDAAVAGNVLGVIPTGQTRATSPWIGLAPTPAAALTYTLDYERGLTDLVTGSDEPLWLPAAFHRLLLIGARRREYEYQSDDRIGVASDDWNAALLKLLTYVNNPPGRIVVPGAVSGVSRSDLGSQYPRGTIWN